jgi:hypothetical protein
MADSKIGILAILNNLDLTPVPDHFDFSAIVANREKIIALRETLAAIADFSNIIKDVIETSNKNLANNCQRFQQILATNIPQQTWSQVAAAAKTNPVEQMPREAIQPREQVPRPIPIKFTPAEVAPNVFIPMIKVQSIDQIPAVPIYWIESCKQPVLIINLGGKHMILNGQIGSIIGKNRPLENKKIRDCHHGNKCNNIDNCSFYHNPLFNPHSKDLFRNFTYNSWQYTTEQNSAPVRHIGTRENIAEERLRISPEELRRIMSQSFFSLLLAATVSVQ